MDGNGIAIRQSPSQIYALSFEHGVFIPDNLFAGDRIKILDEYHLLVVAHDHQLVGIGELALRLIDTGRAGPAI